MDWDQVAEAEDGASEAQAWLSNAGKANIRVASTTPIAPKRPILSRKARTMTAL